jgi:4-amino-4-deoxy-L-arabinose transferase-like glycosyltransferase
MIICSFKNFPSKNNIFLLSLLLIFYLFNGVQYLQSQSITSDEGSFYDYAKRYLKGQPERVYPRSDNSKTPIIVLNTIPRIIEQKLNPGLIKNDLGISDLMHGRYITLLFSVIAILIVYCWAAELYGTFAGLFAAFLLVLCPNNLANAALVTTDSYSVPFLLIAMYFLWKFCTARKYKYFLFFSVTIALSQLVKQSLFHLYVLAPLCMLIYYLIEKPVKLTAKLFFKYIFSFLLINWLIINAGYYFYKTNLSLGDYHFMSSLFIGVQNLLPSWLPVPLPKPFIDGLDMTKYYDQLGGGFDGLSSFGKVTILGQSSTGGSFWYYYFVSIFYKTPVSYLILFFASIIILFRNSSGKEFINREFFLLMPVIYYLITLSFFYKTQCGIRHIIFLYPLMFIFSSRIITVLQNNFQKIAAGVLSIYLIVSVSFYWKNYYPYTNEFIIDKKMAYAYVGAGNLELLQANLFFADYLKTHPKVHRVTKQPQTGSFLINTEEYLDVWNRHEYDWIKHIKPSAQVAYSGLLITVTEKDLLYPNNSNDQ